MEAVKARAISYGRYRITRHLWAEGICITPDDIYVRELCFSPGEIARIYSPSARGEEIVNWAVGEFYVVLCRPAPDLETVQPRGREIKRIVAAGDS